MGRGSFEGEKGTSNCKAWGHFSDIFAKTSEPIEMSFGLWAQMGPRNHVVDGSPDVLRDVAMATNFGTQFAITWASDTQFDSRDGFSGSNYLMKT